mgnify:CR=1 FL=1
MKNKAIFLDRDGTINIDKDYVYKISDFEFIDGAIEGLKKLQELGYLLIVISNQSGIGRGYYNKEQADILFNYMKNELNKNGVHISEMYYCPHYNEDCECRKPKLGLFYQAQREFNIDFSKSYAIGDKLRDIAISEVEHVKGILLDSQNNQINRYNNNANIIVCNNLLDAANIIERNEVYGNSKS